MVVFTFTFELIEPVVPVIDDVVSVVAQNTN